MKSVMPVGEAGGETYVDLLTSHDPVEKDSVSKVVKVISR